MTKKNSDAAEDPMVPTVASGPRSTVVQHGIPNTVPTGEVGETVNGPDKPRLRDVQTFEVRREPVSDLPSPSHFGAHARPAGESEKDFEKRRKKRDEPFE